MDVLSYRTRSLSLSALKEGPHARAWVLLDADGAILGRLASQVAYLLRGKHKKGYTPHMNGGDDVVVLNVGKIRLSGRKWQDKEYVWHTGYPGGQRRATARDIHQKHPLRLLEKAVKGMLPKNTLGRQCFRHLHLYVDDKHPHGAQKPTTIAVK